MVGSPPPGWYPDGSRPGWQRWWDGREWSEVTRYPDEDQPESRERQVESWEHQAEAPDVVLLAPLSVRLTARVIDWVIKTGLGIAIGFDYVRELVRLTEEWQARQPANGPLDVYQLANDTQFADTASTFMIITLLVSVVYTVPLVAARGATPGKWLLRVRVRAIEAEGPPGWRRSLTRWVTREGIRTVPFVGLVYLAMDTVWPLWDPHRQALHDKIPRTVVVRSRR